MLRVEIDAAIGGTFIIVERRAESDAEHYGHYLRRDYPHRLAFEFAVEKYSQDPSRVTIDIKSLSQGCELTLTHDIDAKWAEYTERKKTRLG